MATRRRQAHIVQPVHVEPIWMGYAVWVFAAGVIGFAVPMIFSSLLEMPRNWYLVPYVAITLPFFYGYVRWSGIDVGKAISHNWIWGVALGVLLGALMFMNIISNEPASPRPEGLELIGSMLWLGIVYGTVDALLLTVLPVSAVWLAFKSTGRTRNWSGKILAASGALLASLVVTAVYHAGYAEFRDEDLLSAVFGNGVMSLGFLITANPLTAVITHIALHIVSIWHGVDTTVTLPPHY